MNKFIHIHKLCLGHSFFFISFTGLPSQYHFPSAFSKGHLYLSCSPKAEPGQDIILAAPSHLGSWFHNHRSSKNPCSLKPLCHYCFPYSFLLLTPGDSVSTTSTLGLNVISSHGILPTLSAQWFTSSWDTLVITQNWSFKI